MRWINGGPVKCGAALLTALVLTASSLHAAELPPAPENTREEYRDLAVNFDGKIAEHWDVLQPVHEKAANPHPMF